MVLDSPARELLFGGASGPGKSWVLRAAGILWCLQVPGLQAYLFRRTFPELWLNHMAGESGLPMMVAPLLEKGMARLVGEEVRFWNGSKIFLRHCHDEADRLEYQGAEIGLLLIDELSHFSETIYRFLRGRVRYVTSDPRWSSLLPRIICASNPGGIGHSFVKRTWIDHEPYRIWQTPPEEGGLTRQFIPGRLTDNPYLAQADPNYSQRLEGLGDPLLVRMMLEGDWSVVGDSMYGEEWRREKHVVQPFEIPRSWRIWRSLDDGYHAPLCCLWMALEPDSGRVLVIDELYRSRMTPEMVAEEVRKRDLEHAGRMISGICDTSAFSNIGMGTTRADAMNKMGCNWRPATKGPGSRVQGIQAIHRMLRGTARDGLPAMVFFSRCQRLIEILPTLPRSRYDPEDIDSSAEDHVSDALAYGLQYVGGSSFREVGISFGSHSCVRR